MNTTTYHNCDPLSEFREVTASTEVVFPQKYVIDPNDPPLSRAYKVGHNNCVDMMMVMNSDKERK